MINDLNFVYTDLSSQSSKDFGVIKKTPTEGSKKRKAAQIDSSNDLVANKICRKGHQRKSPRIGSQILKSPGGVSKLKSARNNCKVRKSSRKTTAEVCPHIEAKQETMICDDPKLKKMPTVNLGSKKAMEIIDKLSKKYLVRFYDLELRGSLLFIDLGGVQELEG